MTRKGAAEGGSPFRPGRGRRLRRSRPRFSSDSLSAGRLRGRWSARRPAAAAADALSEAFLDDSSNGRFGGSGTSPTRRPARPGPVAHPSFSSVAAVGFGLTAYTIGAERGWVTRAEAAAAWLHAALPLDAPQGSSRRARPATTASLPLPRHEDRRALSVRRALDDRHGSPRRRRLSCESYFGRDDTARGEDPRRRRSPLPPDRWTGRSRAAGHRDGLDARGGVSTPGTGTATTSP